jgi:hypothetical protein
MTPDLHPGMDDLIQYCMSGVHATPATQEETALAGRVRQHLKDCADCRAQVALLCADMTLVTMAVPQIAAPTGAKARLFQAARLDLADAEAKTVATKINPNVIPMKSRRHSPALIWGGWVAAAACLFYAVQVRESNQGMRRQLLTENAQLVQSNVSAARAQEVLEVLSSPQAQRVTLVAAHAKPEPAGHAVYLPNRGALVFTASNLAPLPANKTYELWVIPANGTAPIPAGTFQPDARGAASVLLPKLAPGIQAKAFGVTMENSGGATTPTMPILLAGG